MVSLSLKLLPESSLCDSSGLVGTNHDSNQRGSPTPVFRDAAMTAIILFDKKDIEDLVAVSGRVAVVQILCVDDPGRHMIRVMGLNRF